MMSYLALPFVALASDPWFWALISLCAGSFMTVAAYRLPLMLDAWAEGHPCDVSLTRPGSFCPACLKPLAWYRNLPLLGFCISRLKPCCDSPVLLRYLALELCAVAWGVFAWWLHQDSALHVWGWSLFGWGLITCAAVDYRTQWLPDVLTLGLLWAGLAMLALGGDADLLVSRVLQVAGVYLGLTGLLWLYEVLRKVPQAMGGGDVKLLCALAAWLDPLALAHVLVLGSALQLAGMLALKKKQAAFGPALCLAALVAYLVPVVLTYRVTF